VRGDDQVFQLSLTEIAFVIVFLLLLLLGWMVFNTQGGRSHALGPTASVADTTAVIAAAERAGNEPDELVRQSGTADRGDVISRLIEREKLTAVNTALRARIEELDRTLSALTEVRNAIAAEKAKDGGAATDAVRREILTGLAVAAAVRQSLIEPRARQERGGTSAQHVPSRETLLTEARSAIALKAAIERRLQTELGRKLEAGTEGVLAAELIAAAGSMSSQHGIAQASKSAEKDNKDLRGQVAFLTARLGVKGGRDYPPCWAEESTGKLQYLFAIDIRNEGLVIRAAWPEARGADAKLLPGINALLAHPPMKLSAFNEAMQGIDQSSKTKNCRHYVLLRNHVKDLDVFNRYRYAVENYFYKLELRT
jgi:hypothetical protein